MDARRLFSDATAREITIEDMVLHCVCVVCELCLTRRPHFPSHSQRLHEKKQTCVFTYLHVCFWRLAGAEPAAERRPQAEHLRGLAQLHSPRQHRPGDEVSLLALKLTCKHDSPFNRFDVNLLNKIDKT